VAACDVTSEITWDSGAEASAEEESTMDTECEQEGCQSSLEVKVYFDANLVQSFFLSNT
jgi:hypothetical protein